MSDTPVIVQPAAEAPQDGHRRSWYAVTARAGRERQAARALETVLPRVTGRAVRAEVPLDKDRTGRGRVRWSGLVLVEISETEESAPDWVQALRDVPGVTGFVGGAPVPLAAEEVDRLRSDERVPAGVVTELSVGDSVTVASGPFAGLPLTVTDLDENRVSGLVNLFGRETAVSVDRYQLAG